MKLGSIEELHDKLFEILCIVDDICQKEKVRYFLDGGTEIGSVREKDFIRWDDDMDVKILAEDYPAFKAAMEKNLPPYMHLVEPTAFAPAFYDFTVRICDERYTIKNPSAENEFYKNYQNYLGTDVFILFKAPEGKAAQKWLVLKTKILYGMGMAHRYPEKKKDYPFLQKMQVTVLTFMGRFVSAESAISRWWKSMLRWENGETNARFAGNYTLKNAKIYPDRWYRTTAYGTIRGRAFPIPGGYDEELTTVYGDYHKPPKDTSAYNSHFE